MRLCSIGSGPLTALAGVIALMLAVTETQALGPGSCAAYADQAVEQASRRSA